MGKFRRTKVYEEIIPQVKSLMEGIDNRVGILANVSALLKEKFPYYFWVGFYIVKGDNLELGPFQGPVACYTIKKGAGVCGHAWEVNMGVMVPDVNKFHGHIACSSETRSEAVMPIVKDDEVVGVIDVDSSELDAFGVEDLDGLKVIADMLAPLF